MPNFCGGCGDEVETNYWKSLLLQPFCENCQPDHKLHRFFPLVCLVFGSLGAIGLFGVYLKSSDKPVNLLTANGVETVSNRSRNLQNQASRQVAANANVQKAVQNSLVDNGSLPPNQADAPPAAEQKTIAGRRNPVDKIPVAASEAIYICGAQTKKGTPCLRRVRGGGRCWQHLGQPAILPPAKLLVSR